MDEKRSDTTFTPAISRSGWEGLASRYFCFLKTSAWSIRFDPILGVAVLMTWIGILPLLVPSRNYSDRGVFVSVAERLLAGDTLYSGVYDNKEPLFYYFVAFQLALGRWAEVAAEGMLIAIAAAATYFTAVKVASRWTSAAGSFIAVPIILTGAFYFPGNTELPGIALVLVAIAASAYGRPVVAGFCIGLLVFLKLIFVPIALVGVGCFLLARRQVSETAAIALCAFVSALAIVGFLVSRAELLPFIETIKLNFAYSQGRLIGSKEGLAVLVEHIRRVGGWRLAGELAPMTLAIMLVLIALLDSHERSRTQLAIAAACISTFVGSLLVLSLTGLWANHTQILYIPSIIAVLGLASLLDVAARRARLPTVGLVILTGYLLAGAPEPKRYIQTFHTAYAALSELSPEAQRLLAIGNSGTYARLGWGDRSSHAIGLRHWKLACPKFHQYPFEPADVLDKVFECASTSPTLIISADFTPLGPPSWQEFVARVEHLLNESYSCDADAALRVCQRRGN